MSTRDLLLMDLYHASRDSQTLALAARHAPIIYFDANEPFLPLAAGYTVFNEDGPSPSFSRTIQLQPEEQPEEDRLGDVQQSYAQHPTNDWMDDDQEAENQQVAARPAAARCVEYAIWWDWDIHHLYELEHIWIYIDANEQPVRVEASWHGKYYEIPLRLENGRAVLLSEPGKHAFAPDPSWFLERKSRFRRVETQSVSLQSSVLVNGLFSGKIRQRVFDRTLARSYLVKQAFQPAWSFTKPFVLQPDQLVPWEALNTWIPLRVNAWLERLEGTIQPSEYRALRIINCEGTRESIQAAAKAEADAVVLPLRAANNRLVIGSPSGEDMDLGDVYQLCQSEPMAAFFEPADAETIDQLAWFVRSNELVEYTAVLSADTRLLSRYKSYVPQGIVIVQLPTPEDDAIIAAQMSGAAFVNPRWEAMAGGREYLTPEWIQLLHGMGLGVVGWPVAQEEDLAYMQRLGVDAVWQELA